MLKLLTDYKKYIIFSYVTILLNIFTGFILFPLIINHLGLEDLAIFGILISLKSIFDIGITWIGSGLSKNLIKYKYLKNEIISFSFTIFLLYGLLISIICFIWGYFYKENYLSSIIFFSLYLFISFVTTPFFQYLISKLEQSKVAFFRMLQQFIFMILSISIFQFFNVTSLSIVFFILFFSCLVIFIILYFNEKDFKIILFKMNKVILNKVLLDDGKKYFFYNFSIILLTNLDLFLITYLYGEKSAAIYLIMWKIPNTLIILGWKLHEPFKAIVAKKIKKDKSYILNGFFALEKKILFFSLLVSFIYYYLGAYILELWIGKDHIINLNYMYEVSCLVIIISIMQGFYTSINYYSLYLEKIVILQCIELSVKILFIIFFFNIFYELAPIVGWLAISLFTIFIYRKYSLKAISDY